MKKKYWLIVILAISISSVHLAIAVKNVKTDHSLVTPYEGSKIYSKSVKQFDEYRAFKGWIKEQKKYETQKLEGKVTKILYKNPPERSVLELYRNYRKALEKEGVTIIYECNQANMECVDGYVGGHLRQQFGIHAIGNKSGRYMFAKLEQEDQNAYLAIAVGGQSTDVHVVEMKKMETDKVALNLTALTDDLDKQGFVIIEGIYFDTDKTELKPKSKPAIDQVAQLLKKRPGLKIYVVGHTDIQGSFSHNMNLSKGRAKAVVTTLINEHGIAAERLESRGVGPLSPVANNTHESGRAKNRRVVIVPRK